MMTPSSPVERLADERADALKVEIAQGVADIAAGRVRELDMHEIKQRGRAMLGLPTDCRLERARREALKVGAGATAIGVDWTDG